MKIVLYGGSFNPPHLGHAAAAQTVSEQLRPDLFLVVPDALPPHKELEEGSPSIEARIALCRLAFREIPNVQVSDITRERKGRCYSADTVTSLRELYPNDELIFLLGTDMFLDFEAWYRFAFLLSECALAVLPREDNERPALEAHAEKLRREHGAKVILLPHEPLPMHSNIIRDRLRRRLGSDMLDERVYAEIIRHRWYDAQPELSWLREKAYAYLKPKRIAHVAGCENEAVMLAVYWGEDPEKAAEAAILHDIGKKYKFEEQLQICEKYGMINDHDELENPKILHAKTGAAIARDVFGTDEAVTGAIRWHCTGKPDMTMLEKIIWLADCIEPNRDFPGVEKLRKLSYEDIDAALASALAMSLEYIRAEGGEPYHDTVEAYRWYSRQED
jgi:nicotinate-nucleotide adenylyltransferase